MLSRHDSDEIRYLEREVWEVERAAWEERDNHPDDWLPTDERLPEPGPTEEAAGNDEPPF
jgi:hypothetical protein